MAKKERRKHEGEDGDPEHTKHADEARARDFTVSVAIGASCIENAQNLELGTLLAGQIARACAIFNVDEIIVLDDLPKRAHSDGTVSASAAHFARVLQFMETPQYLRKALIPMHLDLRYAGMLPPLDAPHHLRASEWCTYREGVVRNSTDQGSFIDVGLDSDGFVTQRLRQGARVTVKMGDQAQYVQQNGLQVFKSELVTPTEPCQKQGRYWGYLTRIAPNLQSLFEDCPFPGGYDLTVGTSERGEKIPSCRLEFPTFQHVLIVFGGPQGLEFCMQNDPWRLMKGLDPAPLFQLYLNTCHDQGSRTIRTEEAILISMAFLQPAINKNR